MITRRLDSDERAALRSGNVYAWEERGQHTEVTGLGIGTHSRFSPRESLLISINSQRGTYAHYSRRDVSVDQMVIAQGSPKADDGDLRESET